MPPWAVSRAVVAMTTLPVSSGLTALVVSVSPSVPTVSMTSSWNWDSSQAKHEVGTQVLFANFSEEDAAYLMPIVARLRREGIRSEIYPEPVKMKKQMSYADSLKIPLRRTGG